MIGSGSDPKACVTGNPAQVSKALPVALATTNLLPFYLLKPRARSGLVMDLDMDSA